jgi:hypothetical protein
METTTRPRAMHALALAASLGLGLSLPAAAAAPAVDAQQPVEELQELDEIWVYGKSLAKRIAEAENEFFYRYNKLNTQPGFRISCGHFTLDRGSMVMRRNCTPAFVESIPALSSASAIGTRWADGCNQRVGYYGSDGFSRTDCSITQIARSRATESRLGNPGMRAVPATPEQRKEYLTHVMKLINTDDALRGKAEVLARLYHEFDVVHEQYVEVKEVRSTQRQGHPRF